MISGYQYFGARYYDSDISVWLSVDPMSDFMPWNSPYCYANSNPIKYIDYDGNIPWPVKMWRNNGWNTRYGFFGEKRPNHIHNGVDINSELGTDNDLGAPVYSTHSGKVVRLVNYNEDKNGGGTRITIESENGAVRTVYMHLNSTVVKEGQVVREGQQIGTVGGSGKGERKSYTAHLHYEVHLKKNGKYQAVNPEIGGRNSGQLIDPQDYVDDPLNPSNWQTQRSPLVSALASNPFSLNNQLNLFSLGSSTTPNVVNRDPIHIQKVQAKWQPIEVDLSL